jgi:transposase
MVRQRTQIGNAIRAMLYEMGLIASKGRAGVGELIERVESGRLDIPAALLASLVPLARLWRELERQIGAMDKRLEAEARADPACRRLMTVPGVGPVTAHAIVATIGDGRQFASARDFAAWVGLTRLNHDTGGRTRLTGHISKAGDRTLRRLLVLGASSQLRYARMRPHQAGAWITGLLARRPVKVAVVAQAAKNARIAWAVLAHNQPYRANVAA